MLGAIIGDMAGSIYEHHNLKSKVFPFYGPRSSPTDDSIMTIAVAKAVLEADGDYDELERLAVKWMRIIGRQYPHCGYGRRFKGWLYSDETYTLDSFGNGAAMRVSPCGWAGNSLDEVRKLSYAVTCVTHGHPEGIKGAEAVACAVYLARTGSSMDGIREFIEDGYYKLDFTLDGIRKDYSFDVTCQGSVPQAIEAFLESESFEDAIRNAISIGGDSDTIAAVTGSIAEAYYGIPDEMRSGALERFDSAARHRYKDAYMKKDPDLIGIIEEFDEKMKKQPEFIYVEPVDYFPEELRKKYGLGEYYNKGNED